ncbi:MAG: ChbG/HpnK family deacetylase [Fimbriimonas sp.]
MVKLITRGDDAGSCDGANRAIQECISAGTLKNVSLMVPGPAFEAAAEMLRRHMDSIDIGLHVTLNSEWETFKWGPVSSDVPSLKDEGGWFTLSPGVLQERAFVLEEALREVRAQIAKARAAGLRLDYLDEHMGIGWLPGLRDGLHQIAKEERLRTLETFDFLPNPPTEGFLDYLSRLDEGPYVYVTHPGVDDATMNRFVHMGLEPGQIARERDAERLLLTSPPFKEAMAEGIFSVCRFSEA